MVDEKSVAEDGQRQSGVTDVSGRQRLVLEAAFLVAVVIVLAGFALSNLSPRGGHYYWLASVPPLAACAIVAGNAQGRHGQRSPWRAGSEQLVHWGVTALGMLVLHLLLRAGRLSDEASGLLAMVVLGQTLLLDGLQCTGWRFSALGVALMGMTLLVGWLSGYMWALAAIGVLFWVVTTALDIHLQRRRQEAGSRA